MKKSLKQYRGIVGEKALRAIYEDSSELLTKHIVHVNSTHYGGGVAEILTNLVFLMNDLGISTGWRVLKGSPEFFTVTKKFHNALQGDKINLSAAKKRVYLDFNEGNSSITHIQHHDCVIIHDMQPLPFIKYYKKRQPWIWRCHIDLSRPNPLLWRYLKGFVKRYDAMVVSTEKFKRSIPTPTFLIPPSIDPLSPKNEDVKETKIQRYLSKKGIDLDKPIVCQVSRFDKWKDPLGVIRAFELVREKVDCKLVMMGGMATDDPEGPAIYNRVVDACAGNPDIALITEDNNFLVNCLQRASDVAVQKSLKEGFALTVSEALWKGTPVVGSNVGGIPLQIKNGKTGYLVEDVEHCARSITKLLKNPKLARKIGSQGKEYVRDNFLITRHLHDYVKMLKSKEVGLVWGHSHACAKKIR